MTFSILFIMTRSSRWSCVRKKRHKRRPQSVGQCASAFVADLVRVDVKISDRAVGLVFLDTWSAKDSTHVTSEVCTAESHELHTLATVVNL